MIVGRLLLSFWDGIFSGAMLDFQGVVLFCVGPLEKRPMKSILGTRNSQLKAPYQLLVMHMGYGHKLLGQLGYASNEEGCSFFH